MLFCYEMTGMKKGTEKRDGSIFFTRKREIDKIGIRGKGVKPELLT
jgi:hypothetical protein